MQNGHHFSPASKVWIYQSSRPFTADEIIALNQSLAIFAKHWTAHNMQLNAEGFVYKDRIIVLMVDETATGASGCSIDKSVHFIKSLEAQYQTTLFDRTLVNYLQDDGLVTITLQDIRQLAPDTSMLNPLVQSKKEFDERLIVPLKESWYKQFAS